MKAQIRVIMLVLVTASAFHFQGLSQKSVNPKFIFNPSDDATIHKNAPDFNDGSDTKLTIRNKFGGTDPYFWERDVLINFDISSIPNGSQIQSATLNLFYYDYWDNDPGGRALTCYKLTQNWNEESVTFNNQPAWIPQLTSSSIVPYVPGFWMTWDVTADVLEIINNQEGVNHGWKIMDEEPWGWANIPISYFRSKEFGEMIPYLEITLNTTTSCPGPTVTYEGQVYHTVQIGTQCWLKENLNVGSMINGNQDPSNNGLIEKYCYNNDPANCNVYGGLYQWDEVMSYSAEQGVQGICPNGWHIPTDNEWCTMTTGLDPTVNCNVTYGNGTDCGAKMREPGFVHWKSPNIGATNSSGFTSLGSGMRETWSEFTVLQESGFNWSSSQYSSTHALEWHTSYNNMLVARVPYPKACGFGVRCVKDAETGCPVSVTIAPSSDTVCAGSLGTFTATPVNGGTSPSYQWKVNGINAGTNDSIFTYVPANNDIVNCILTSNAPCATGNPATSNSVAIIVKPVPVPIIIGSDNLCINSGSYFYFTDEGKTDYYWTISSGGQIIWGAGTNLILVTWYETGEQWLKVNYTDVNGCSAASPTELDVTVNPLPGEAGLITGKDSVCTGETGVAYSIAPVPNAIAYVWSVPSGAEIDSGYGTNNIFIDFTEPFSSGMISVFAYNLCGYGSASPEFSVNMIPVPSTPVISANKDTLSSNTPEGNQWYFGNELIPGATGQILIANRSGWYQDIVTLNGCSSDTSSHLYVQITGIDEKTDAEWNLYPNPNDGCFQVGISASKETSMNITVYDLLGKDIRKIDDLTVKHSEIITIDLRPIPEGIYNVAFRWGNNLIVRKILVTR
jgi:uncharacterized protein (TIGR02145 family)